MIINMVKELDSIIHNKTDKAQCINSVKELINQGFTALSENDEVIYIIQEKLHIKTFPLYETGKEYVDLIRNTKDFTLIHKANTLDQEIDLLIDELKESISSEHIKLLDDYIELKENQPLFGLEIVSTDSVTPKVLKETIGLHYRNIKAYMAGFLNSLGVDFSQQYIAQNDNNDSQPV